MKLIIEPNDLPHSFTKGLVVAWIESRIPGACITIIERRIRLRRPWWAFWRKDPGDYPSPVLRVGPVPSPEVQAKLAAELEEIRPAGMPVSFEWTEVCWRCRK